MYWFLIPLLFGFACNLASAFTAAFSRRWGERRGSMVTVMLRDVLGIPVWAIGFVLAFRQPSPRLFPLHMAATAVSLLLLVSGAAIILVALATIRLRAARPTVRDCLACQGIYGHVRHPIHSGTLLEFAGLVLMKPTVPVALASGLGAAWMFAQTALEEKDLLERLPGYRDYMAAVPRFLPRFRKGSGRRTEEY